MTISKLVIKIYLGWQAAKMYLGHQVAKIYLGR